ncbi:MAG: hypothetical protein E6K78_11775 [Candidatus Eisenbacteria bacterium]|uniref:DUF2219 family protein n=1 Tax=Eiseniibacteriota bacterium TaxID=2212470 RepID=A0A538TFQ5_UNCEI|nr:MAG: hypothetical protein E6K78_11775 [Candidatus Eisenbacteria bacterium]
MNVRIALAFLGTAALALATISLSAHAGPWGLAPGEYYSEFRSSFFAAHDYADQNGDRRALAGGGLVQGRSLVSYNEVGWKKRLSFILGIPAESITRRYASGADTSYRPTATGLGDGLVGLRYRLLDGKTGVAIELDWKPPLGYDRNLYVSSHGDSVHSRGADGSLDFNRLKQIGSPTLGDGQQDVTLALHAGAALPALRGFFEASGGYKYRFEKPSDQIVGSADLGVWVRPSFLVAGRYQGEIATQSTEGGTLDPDWHRVGPTVIYRVDDRMDLIASSLFTITGTNTLHYPEYFVGVAFKNTKLNRLQGFLGGTKAP